MQAKLPPHSIEAEQSVLGGLLISDRSWVDIADRINADDFYREDHRRIFEAISALAVGSKSFDQITVTEWLRESGKLRDNLAVYIGTLAVETPSAANITAYAEIVRERSMARAMIATGSQMVESGFTQDATPIGEKLDEAEKSLMAIRDTRATTGPAPVHDVLRETVADMEAALSRESDLTGLPTGLTDLDAKTGGLQPEDLIYIAGRPSMGKTSVATAIAEKTCLDGGAALIFSMEMGRKQIMQRAISRHSGVLFERIRNAKRMETDDWPMVTDAIGRFNESNLLIDDTPGLTIMDVRARARRQHRKTPLSLIVLDYIQLMSGDAKANNRNAELEPISRGLKGLAKELHIPVVALSQLSRKCEEREDKRPRMSDLRDSGNLEQDADLILFVYRDEVYREDSPHEGVAELIIGKQRNGELGTVDTVFQGECVRFRDYSGPCRAEREGRGGKVRSIRGRGGFNYGD